MKEALVRPPRSFVSLQAEGYTCANYYTGSGGQKVGLTPEILAGFGLHDDTLWVHPDVIAPLAKARQEIKKHGYDLLIRDAWRPMALYSYLINYHRNKRSELLALISLQARPHATGCAIDAVLVDSATGKELWLRNQARDGRDSCIVGFYRGQPYEESVFYQSRQDILISSFLNSGWKLGSKREYWHFELKGITTHPRF